ncbi:MAG: hypothetical protein RH917_14680 [Lacipirellulaceae bacterium]
MRRNLEYRQKARRCLQWRAFSFLEVIAVVTLIGIVSLAAISRFGHSSLENLSAEGYARLLQRDLMQARQRTVATGDNHYLSLTTIGGEVTTYTMWRRASGGDVAVDQARTTPTGLTVTASHTTLEFDFDGSALASYVVTAAGPDRSWQVSAIPATGLCQVADVSP